MKLLKIFCIIIITVVTGYTQSKFEIKKISFEGNRAINTSTLKGIIKTKETPWWGWKFLNSFTPLGAPAVYFDSSDIAVDLIALNEYYITNGFFKTNINYNYIIDTTDEEVELKYIISEGEFSTYKNIELRNLKSVPDNVLVKIIDLVEKDSTDRFNQESIQNDILNSVTTLQNNGYMLARYDSTLVVTDTTNNKVDVEVFYNTGNRYVIDSIQVVKKGDGAYGVDDEELRELTDLKIGETYSAEKLRMSQIRLFRTGLFNSINLSGEEKDTSGNKIPILLEGSIGRLNELSPEIIINNQQSAFNFGLGGSYIRKNFLGSARKLTLKSSFGVQDFFNTDFGKLFKSFSFRDTVLLGYFDTRLIIEQPYLFNKKIFGTWENYVTINKQKTYNTTIYGSKLTFEFELPEYTFINRLSAFYNIESANEVYKLLNNKLTDKVISVIGLDIGRNAADDVLFPTSGYIITMQLEEANSIPLLFSRMFNYNYNGSLFYRVVFNSSAYYSLDSKKRIILAGKFKTGRLQAYYGDYLGVPINRTFYAGGSNSVRGWRSNELIPAQEQSDLYGIYNLEPKGGTFLLEGSIELRMRLLENIGTAIFVDYGNTFLGHKTFRFTSMALAGGIGFRYYTAVAPFRVDFGFKLFDPADQKFITEKPVWRNFEFHFGIGEAF